MLYVRRVQLTGRSTLIVSLPRDWARRAGVGKGSRVLIEVLPDNSLRISPSFERAERPRAPERVIDLRSSSASAAAKALVSAYVAGYRVFRVLHDESGSTIAQTLRDLVSSKIMDVVVTDESSSGLTMRVVGSQLDLGIGEAVALAARHVSYMFRDLVEGMKRGDLSQLQSVRARDDLVDRLYLSLTRRLVAVLSGEVSPAEAGLESPAEALHYYHGFKALERVADHVASMAEEASKIALRGGSIGEDLVAMVEEASSIFSRAASALSKLDAGAALRLADEIESRRIEVRRLLESAAGGEAARYGLLMSLSRVLGYSLDMVEDVLDVLTLKELLKSVSEAAR
ncbi:MAG: PhoU domain-containing protein [Fervidicoccaceae archaeon]